jgi:transposase-like protein
VSYKSALFMMHRIRFAMAENPDNQPKLTGTVEADETYVGARKPRHKGTAANPINRRGRGTNKQPVAAVLQRGGKVRTRVVPNVNTHNIRAMLRDNVDRSAHLITDEWSAYTKVGPEFASHETVNHHLGEYARGNVHTNSIEGFFARVKRGLTGVYHNVSKRHLHRYMSHFEFMHNTRAMNDGDRTLALIRAADGKRLRYRDPMDGKGRYVPPTDPQLPPFGETA